MLHRKLAETNYVTGNIKKIRNKFTISYIITFIIFSFCALIIIASLQIFGFVGFWILIIGISLIISLIIGLIFAYLMPSLTLKGAEEKWKWLGFKEYLHTAERFRLGIETVKTFSKYLPYAIVFGVEKEWANRFADLKYQQPNWYVPIMIHSNGPSGMGNSFKGLSSSISSFTSSISSTFSSTPGGSGVGGGGGAGGGGGGGGGGAG